MAELTKQFEGNIQSIRLIPSEGGRFEVTIDGQLIYSKLETRRHANPGEVAGLIGGRPTRAS
jgi:selenoprotein W-related protein